MQQKKKHFNVPQLRAMLVNAFIAWIVMGRGTGKTEGVLAPATTDRIKTMPRAGFGLIGATFQQILVRTLPPLVKGWEELGYINGIHYLIGQKPTEKWKKLWKWPGAYRLPQKFEHTITWWNGTIIQMLSQDRIGSTNGMSLDGIFGDEAKLLNRDRLHTETFPANRGKIFEFRNNPHHHGMVFTTDMPVGTSGRWILDKEQDCDKERVKQILQLQVLRMKLLQHADIQKVDAALNELRKGLVYYDEASTLDNIHALGIEYIRDMMRELSDYEFKTSILNRKPMKLEDGFYPDLDEDKHGYFAYDYHKFENTGYDFQKLKEMDGAAVDADYKPLMPMHIALDNNRRIVPLVVGQVHMARPVSEIRRINSFHSLYPEKLEATLNKFCTYYKHHLKKVVYYWYDQTSIAEYGHAGSSKDEVLKYLRRNGWTVIERYIGAASGHERRYNMWGHLLQEDDTYPYVYRINRDRNKFPLLSMYQAQAIKTKRGFGKNKKAELDPKFPAEEAPHFSEAEDMLVWGILESGMSFIQESSGIGFEMIG